MLKKKSKNFQKCTNHIRFNSIKIILKRSIFLKKQNAQTFVFNLLGSFDLLIFLVTSAASSDSLILYNMIKTIINS